MAVTGFVVSTLVELADTLVDDFDVVDLLTVLTDRCVEGLEVDAAGLMLVSPPESELRVMASSSPSSHDLELYELQASEGPCIDSHRAGESVTAPDISEAVDRWPLFAPAALAAGFRAAYAVPMRLRGTTIGALNLFRATPGSLAPDDEAVARAFADVATIAVLQHWAMSDARVLADQLSHALQSRVVIEQAKGMLAERAGIEVGEAFTWLRGYARPHNLKLGDVAAGFLGGSVPLADLRPADRR